MKKSTPVVFFPMKIEMVESSKPKKESSRCKKIRTKNVAGKKFQDHVEKLDIVQGLEMPRLASPSQKYGATML